MENILTLLVPIILGVMLIKVFVSQVGCLVKLLVNSLSGFVCLWLLNLLSGITGILFPINLLTTLLVGFLGIPGIILLVLGQFMG